MEFECPSCGNGQISHSDTCGQYCSSCGLILASYHSVKELTSKETKRGATPKVKGHFERDENGFLQYYTGSGRKRRHWKAAYRRKSHKFLKGYCERCGRLQSELSDLGIKLTIHHRIPLREEVLVTKENCETLCEDCHNEHNTEEARIKNGTFSGDSGFSCFEK